MLFYPGGRLSFQCSMYFVCVPFAVLRLLVAVCSNVSFGRLSGPFSCVFKCSSDERNVLQF